MPTLSDYGGHNHKKHRRSKVSKTNTVSMRCLDCQKLRYVIPRELHRAAAPRCLECGGPLEKTSTQTSRDDMPTITATELAGVSTPRCRSCGKQLHVLGTDNVASALTEHLQGSSLCLDYYVEENMLIVIGVKPGFEIYDNRLIIAGTLDLRPGPHWKLKGLCPNGEIDFFGSWNSKNEAIDFGRSVLVAHIAEHGNPDGRIIPDGDSVWA